MYRKKRRSWTKHVDFMLLDVLCMQLAFVIGYGKETCNPAGRFLGAKGNDKIAKLTADAWAVYSEEAYEKVLDILCGAVADYVEQNPDLRNQPTEDMWDFKDEEEDQDDSWDEEEDDWDEEEDYEDEDY